MAFVRARVGQRYGTDRLRQRLAQRRQRYGQGRNREPHTEPRLTQATAEQTYVSRDRAALVLTSIGQVWGNTNLRQAIGLFYRQHTNDTSLVTSANFVRHLARQLPDSLRYLTTYLTHRYRFNFSIGRVAQLPNALAVDVWPAKWTDDGRGHRQPVPLNDWVPIVVYDVAGRVLHRQLVRPEPDEKTLRLPLLPGAALVEIDPLGAWGDATQWDNRKSL